MTPRYRLVVDMPATASNAAKVWEWTPDTGNVLSVRVSLKKENGRVSTLVARLYDPKWAVFNQLPDPAYCDAPVKLYLAKSGDQRQQPVLVFSGRATEYAPEYPGDLLTIAATDRSIEARRNHRYRVLTGKNSVQIAQTIAKDYGLSVDATIGSVSLLPRSFDVAAGDLMTDWDVLARALIADGLQFYVTGERVVIFADPTHTYSPAFRRDDDERVLRFAPKILHVSGPGVGGDVKKQALDVEARPGNVVAFQGSEAKLADAAEATRRTHMRPISVDETAARPWSNSANLKRKRKDTASLSLHGCPEIGLHHTVSLSGWGGKVDGAWQVESVEHNVIGTDSPTQEVSMMRPASNAGRKSAGVSAGLGVEVR